MSRSHSEPAADILDAIAAIERFDALISSAEPKAAVIEAALDAVCYQVIVIGEAVKTLDSTFTEQHPEVPWSNIARKRDLITHHYHRRDAAVIRATIGEPLATLKTALTANR